MSIKTHTHVIQKKEMPHFIDVIDSIQKNEHVKKECENVYLLFYETNRAMEYLRSMYKTYFDKKEALSNDAAEKDEKGRVKKQIVDKQIMYFIKEDCMEAYKKALIELEEEKLEITVPLLSRKNLDVIFKHCSEINSEGIRIIFGYMTEKNEELQKQVDAETTNSVDEGK